jgi:6-pyruvoyltetrahydropterin/6-carboxytetrahydropterin synthase
VRIRRRFEFEAAHELPGHTGECRNLHGHSYKLLVSVDRAIEDRSGMAMDFSDLKKMVKREVIDHLDHRLLNELMDNPTAEMIAVWIWDKLEKVLPGLSEVELHETANCSVVYRGE